MSTMLGKGANCAILDVVSLSENITPFASQYTCKAKLAGCTRDNLKRRAKERQRSAVVQSLVNFGDGKLRAFCREKGLKMALTWVEERRRREDVAV